MATATAASDMHPNQQSHVCILSDVVQDGNDAAARRRRAQLLGTLDDGNDADLLVGHGAKLDFVWQDDEENEEAQQAQAQAFLRRYQQQKKLAESQQVRAGVTKYIVVTLSF